MDLWNEYEGKNLAEPYPLEKLIDSEGRSGFFLTSNGAGAPAIVRLTQASNDNAELLAQWHAVAALNEPHLVVLKSFGQTVLDRVSVTFAVMESPDATLAEILRERPMTAEETRQIAVSLVSALRALHEHGLAHGQLNPASVVAIGEAIKLRSDCARKIEGHDDAAKLRDRDVRDLAILLRACLTQKRAPAGELPRLPEPFEEIIARGLEGAWSLEDISKALGSPTLSVAATVASEGAGESASGEAAMPASAAALDPGPEMEAGNGGAAAPPSSAKAGPPAAISARDRNFLVATAGVTVSIVFWLFLRLITGHVPEIAGQSSQASGAVANSAAAPAIAGSASRSALAPSSARADSAPSNAASWRVVAYSFRREDEAKDKAEALLQKHSWIDPEVVKGTGRLPYLVTLGGRMTREDAIAFERKLQLEHFHHAVHPQEIDAK